MGFDPAPDFQMGVMVIGPEGHEVRLDIPERGRRRRHGLGGALDGGEAAANFAVGKEIYAAPQNIEPEHELIVTQ